MRLLRALYNGANGVDDVICIHVDVDSKDETWEAFNRIGQCLAEEERTMSNDMGIVVCGKRTPSTYETPDETPVRAPKTLVLVLIVLL